MTRYRIATIALTLAVAVGVPAITAAAQQPNEPSSPATANPCSEVCSGGGYALGNSNTTGPADSPPAILRGAPAPCSEVCSGGGYGFVSQSSGNAASIPPAAGRVVTLSEGFDWGDAGIGAGGMLAVIGIGLGGALTLTHRRNHRIREQDASSGHP
jgi:hypothetical protein